MVDEIKPANNVQQTQQSVQQVEEKKSFFDKFKKKEETPAQPVTPTQSDVSKQVKPATQPVIQPGMEQPSKVLGIIGTVCGVLGLGGMFVMPFIGLVLGIAGLVLAILQIRKHKNIWAWIALGVSIVAILGSFGLVAWDMFKPIIGVQGLSPAGTLPVQIGSKNIVF